MKNNITLSILFLVVSACNSFGQTKRPTMNDSNWTIPDVIYTAVVNNFDIENPEDTFYNIIRPRIEALEAKGKLNHSDEHSGVFLTNKNGTQYLHMLSSHGGYYGDFVTIGYLEKNGKYGDAIGKLDVDGFEIEDGIKLGDPEKKVWDLKHLLWFRSFEFKDVRYFYFEKGKAMEGQNIPGRIYYYKFKNDKLIEVGFGKGIPNFNPLLRMVW